MLIMIYIITMVKTNTHKTGRNEMETIINIIPTDYEGDPKKALGYCWQDYATKTPGHDMIIDTTGGIDRNKVAADILTDMGIEEAYFNFMWCGGFQGTIKNGITCSDVPEMTCGETINETASIVKSIENLETEMMNTRNSNHAGWCDKCLSYCFGDCEVN